MNAIRSGVSSITSRSKLGRDDIKWQELLLHFRSIQAKHEKARRQAMGTDTPFTGFAATNAAERSDPIKSPSLRPPARRKVTGQGAERDPVTVPAVQALTTSVPPRSGALSPLNPRARGPTSFLASALSSGPASQATITGQPPPGRQQKRALSLSRK